jgi:P22 coat protein - gene protein 5
MAFLTSDRISALAVELLTRSIVLPMTVSRVPEGDFNGGAGDTVLVRIRQPGNARVQASAGAAITYDTLSETSVPVVLRSLYHATKVTDQDLTLNLVDFGRQVLSIQTDAVARGAEDEVADVINDVAADDTVDEADPGSTAGIAETKGIILAAREALASANVPLGGRWAAISAEFATRVLSVPEFTRVDNSGSDQALRRAVIGTLFGFTFVESNAVEAGSAAFYHGSAFAFATRTPATPAGAADAATAEVNGVGLRHIRQYDPDHLSDASVVSTFGGASLVDADRVYKVSEGS